PEHGTRSRSKFGLERQTQKERAAGSIADDCLAALMRALEDELVQLRHSEGYSTTVGRITCPDVLWSDRDICAPPHFAGASCRNLAENGLDGNHTVGGTADAALHEVRLPHEGG